MRILLAALVSLGLATAAAYARPADTGHAPVQQQQQQTPGIGWG